MIDNYAECVAMSLIEKAYLGMMVNPLTCDVFPAYKENIQINTGANLRYLNVYRSFIRTDGRKLTGTTYRGVILTRENPRVINNPSSTSGQTLYKADFRPIAAPSYAQNLYLTLDVFLAQNGSTRNTSIYVWTYNSDGEIYGKSTSFGTDGYTEITYLLDSQILTNGNICVCYQTRDPKSDFRLKFNLFASADDIVGKYGTLNLTRYGSQIVQD